MAEKRLKWAEMERDFGKKGGKIGQKLVFLSESQQ